MDAHREINGGKHFESVLYWMQISQKEGIPMELLQGRPADCSGRLAKEIRVYDLLDRLGISYQRIDHEATNTMEACAAVDEVLDATICKNLLLCNRQNTVF